MLLLRLSPLLGSLILMGGINYATPTQPEFNNRSPAERVEFDMNNFRDDFCFDCVDLCADPKVNLNGRRYYIKLVQRAVAKFPPNRVSSQCPNLCTAELSEWLPAMIWRSLYSLAQSIPVSDPTSSDIPFVQDLALSRIIEYQCHPDDRGYRKRDPPRLPYTGGDHQRSVSDPTSELPKPNRRPEDFGVSENEDEPPRFMMNSLDSLRGLAGEKTKEFMSLLGAAARKSVGAHPVKVPIRYEFAVP